MRDNIPEPHEIADAYYARQEEAWERLIKNATCADCEHYTAAPDKWVSTPCGWCSVDEDFIEGEESVKRLGCESFDPNTGYEPVEDDRDWDDWEDYSEWGD